MRRAVTSGIVAAAVAVHGLAAAAEPSLLDRDGAPVAWNVWIGDHGPAAIVVYASWAPRAEGVLASLGDLDAAARARDLRLVVVAVQEPFEDSRTALSEVEVEWLHDRHGVLLKRYRVLRIPSVLVIGSDGVLRASLDPDPDQLRSGETP